MATAACLIRNEPHYRKEAFHQGLRRLGFDVTTNPLRQIYPDDVLVIWNRGPGFDHEAKRHEAAGSRVIVSENGMTDARDEDGHQLFSLAMNWHNGAGHWFTGDSSRWSTLGIELQAWRPPGSEVLLLPQRGIGVAPVAMPRQWVQQAQKRVRELTDRPGRVRAHPGLKSKAGPLEPDLKNAHAVVTWASSAALKALIYGVPAFYCMPGWIGAGASKFLPKVTEIESVKCDDFARVTMFERLAWCQWKVSEIASGYALDWLLSPRGRPS